MARAMWRGAIQFGLVTIPVRLYLATESRGVSFNMLHADCLSRIQMKIYCPVHDAVVPRNETVKGFEYAPGEYVVVTDEDLESVPLKTVRSIEIELFTPRQADGPVRFVKQAYYVEPEKIGRKAFTLLREILAEQGLTAICKVVIKDREALAAIDPFGPTMLLSTLHWPDEIRATGELDLPDAASVEVKPAERAMAGQLIAAMTAEFDPANYQDEYRDALMRIIDAKVAGRETVTAATAEPATNIVDLMAALEASVKAAVKARDDAQPRPVAVGDRRAATAKEHEGSTSRRRTAAAQTGGKADSDAAGRETTEAPARRRRSA